MSGKPAPEVGQRWVNHRSARCSTVVAVGPDPKYGLRQGNLILSGVNGWRDLKVETLHAGYRFRDQPQR
jgi:hypothetical protein